MLLVHTRWSRTAAERKAEDRVRWVVGRRRGRHADMAPTVGIVPIALDFLRGNRNEFPIFTTLRHPMTIFKFGLRRIAVSLVATRLGRLIRHEPGGIELLVNRQIGGRVSGMMLLGKHR